MYNFRTDLALERRDIYKESNNIKGEIDGIISEEEEVSKTIKVTRVNVVNENGAKSIQKPIGTYTTIDVEKMRNITEEEISKISNIMSSELKKLINKHVGKTDEILIVGLGNEYSTPDSLGPKVVREVDVTRHIFKYLPQFVEDGDREVSAIAPGVLGVTGIETQEILKGIVDNVKPKLIIAIDSLASKSIDRISSSVGVGIPTVVELATLVSDGIDIFIKTLQEKAESNDYLNKLKENDKYEEVKEALNVGEYNMIVTPKEIDDLIENMKNVKLCNIKKERWSFIHLSLAQRFSSAGSQATISSVIFLEGKDD